MREARNVESENDHEQELPLNPLDHDASNRCIRVPEHTDLLKIGTKT